MDPTRVATAIVASPAWDLAVVASVVVAGASVGVVDSEEAVDSVVVEAEAVEAEAVEAEAVVDAGNEPDYRNTNRRSHSYETNYR
jgi:hypothetical protein